MTYFTGSLIEEIDSEANSGILPQIADVDISESPSLFNGVFIINENFVLLMNSVGSGSAPGPGPGPEPVPEPEISGSLVLQKIYPHRRRAVREEFGVDRQRYRFVRPIVRKTRQFVSGSR